MLAHDQLDAVCRHIQELQVHRKHAIKLLNKCTNSIIALTARYCGYDANVDETARKKLFARAERIVSRGLKGKPQDEADQQVAEEIEGELQVVFVMLPPLIAHREKIDAEMDALAEELPGGELIAATPGFSRHGLAIIIGEAGNLLNYPDKGRPAHAGPYCLWRRLGLGLMPGREARAFSTWRKLGGLSAVEWEEAGYSPRRLAQIYGVVTEPLIKHKAKSKYGEVYAKRRARTKITHPEWYLDKAGNKKINNDTGEVSSSHANNDAVRIMTKELIRDLWSEWQRAIGSMKPIARVPSAPTPIPLATRVVKPTTSVPAEQRASEVVKPKVVLPSAPIQETTR